MNNFTIAPVESQEWGPAAPLHYEPHMVVLEVQLSNSTRSIRERYSDAWHCTKQDRLSKEQITDLMEIFVAK